MAKIKKAEDNAPVAEQAIAQEVEATKENTEVEKTEVVEPETEATKVEDSATEEKDEASAKSQDDIPEYVLAYLKNHTEEKAVYFDKLGGVFSADTPKVFLKDAVLYQNPFCKQ
ncbi:hypothetical protein [Prevotella sp. MGM2]|uniref:hypothetical protein n=1 Tax=Prevotella sp. MGM2 TaxID=2033406 RepID=UPI000CE9F90B|nr:hypothetical protein [Prevotella sp. MGM2]GAY31011.1 hypothetical protein PvtlMGM2_1864 [Prevotella sp. MGM2]